MWKPKPGLDDFGLAENFLPRQLNAFLGIGVEAAAIADGQETIGRLAGVDHLLALLHGDFHRFFAQDMLVRLGRLEGQLGMERVGRDDINHVDVRVVRHLLHVFVVIDVLVGNVVLRLPFFGLVRVASDDAGQPAILGLGEGGRKLVGGQAAQAAEGKTQLAVRVIGPRGGRKFGDPWRACGGQSGGFKKTTAAGQNGFHAAKPATAQMPAQECFAARGTSNASSPA
jgi:hypothetical protein